MYVNKQQLIDRFGQDELIQLTDRSTPAVGDIDDDVVNAVIDDVSSLIDSHLQARYTLPLINPPRVLQRFAGDIVRYYLYEDRATERVTELYNDAMKYLAAVRDGKINLGLPAAEEPTATNTPDYDAPDRVFTHDTLADY
jgi:phage gp36-like protein